MTAVDDNPADARATGHDDYLRVLDAIQTGALHLLAGFPRQPSALRFQVGEVTVEAEWQAVAPPSTAMTVTEAPVESIAAPESPAIGPVVRAPSVGVFYRRPEPGSDPFVEVGDRVQAGQQIAIVEAMKLMIPVTAQTGGVITGILKEDNEPVQFDEPLFSYSPE
ncbi:acetyl-CoA carboxylase biotin carboxyl carrier protein [Nocardia amikacinitolerans]|uniref:Biotin carboxyl carrier protein of acetyl-CoA carboxylase n=1 Tax=Nocardia amikacinitolerans TaxID=756689 RepID=A0A285L0N8_9NOCA|nr:biotin/lipoyl-containing protein [Nocardia amikacinitolerans]MCP2279398.1 acetyl-CoA carboxylase biotin carboxyl carrier protein [Nocardia amikacinitolerans]MCP2296805.1 acetyl-CoA carboxylase biotin carboxyl carrier protein [Nocardia amikacinitolerans]SNY78492.1 acetyl-CoA carboxylase biotin carboxyl carrier protein [Nocardia amikacinitolerans]